MPASASWLQFNNVEFTYLQLNKIDFCDSVKTLGFSEELQLELYQQYAENQADIRRIESFMSASVPHYRDLQWRLDIQVGCSKRKFSELGLE